MGTQRDILETQALIKRLAAELGWSQNRLADVLYTELHDWDDEDEMSKFRERLKKELQRPTTKMERLRVYLDLLVAHPDVKKLDVVFNKHIPLNAISTSLSQGLMKISQEIDQLPKR